MSSATKRQNRTLRPDVTLPTKNDTEKHRWATTGGVFVPPLRGGMDRCGSPGTPGHGGGSGVGRAWVGGIWWDWVLRCSVWLTSPSEFVVLHG